MRFKEFLQEAPLADYKTHGDFKTRQSHDGAFKETDRKLIKHEVHAAKMYKFFSKSPIDFRIIDANVEDGYNLQGEANGEVRNLDDLREIGIEGKTLEDIKKNKANAITCIFTGNDSDDPMTPWIHAHRIGHVYDDDTNNALSNEIEDLFRDVLKKYYGNIPNNSILKPAIINLIKLLLTMKSVRNEKLSDIGEAAVELFAQYILKGHVEIKPLPKEVKWEGYEKHKFSEYTAELNNEDSSKAHTELENKIGEIIDKALKSMVGKVYLY